MLVALALVALLVYGVAAKKEDRTIDDALKRGDRVAAPDHSKQLPEVGGGKLALDQLKNKVVILNFWASWCEPCKLEAPALQKFQREAVKKDGTVVGVSYRDTEPDAQEFIKHYGLTYPNVRDINGDLARGYSTLALPETFVLDRNGKIAAAKRGPVDSNWLRQYVEPLLNEPA